MNHELYENVYWVGDTEQINALHCNPYLIIEGDEAVLFDPGSSFDFEKVYQNVTELTSIESIKYVVLSHQDPDLCAALPLFEQKGLKASVVCHWRTSVIIQYYNIISPFYLADQNNFSLELKTGRKLDFIHAPYLHFPGALLTYDSTSKILFSGDLFGGFSLNWGLFADDGYEEAMEAFHETYMPSNDILRPIMEFLLSMDISIIAPQHGSIIIKDIKKHIKCLRDLECGTFLTPIKKAITSIGGYTGLCNKILKRYYSLFNPEEVRELFLDTDIVLDDQTYLIKDFSVTGGELWDYLFEVIYTKKGMSWIAALASQVEKLSKEYDVDLPQIFKSVIYDIEKTIETLSDENKHLRELNERLERNLQSTQDKLIKCPITKLYNETFFRQYLETETKNAFGKNEDFAILIIDLDNLAQLNFKYGNKVGDETLQIFAYTIKQLMPDTHLLFKLKGSEFAYYIPEITDIDPFETAENIRSAIEQSAAFIEKITATIGLVQSSGLYQEGLSHAVLLERMIHLSRMRVRAGKSQGMNVVCATSGDEDHGKEAGTVLLVDTDEMNLNVLSTVLDQAGYDVAVCKDGLCALDVIEKRTPDCVICELMVPKLDGFSLRERMLKSSELKSTNFILLSYQKDEALVERAFEHNIQFFLKKPFMMTELLGIIRTFTDVD
jgi:two-component system, cell cycle response regulator